MLSFVFHLLTCNGDLARTIHQQMHYIDSSLARQMMAYRMNERHCYSADTVRPYQIISAQYQCQSPAGNRIPVNCFRRYSVTCKFDQFIRQPNAGTARNHASFYINFPIELAMFRGRINSVRVTCNDAKMDVDCHSVRIMLISTSERVEYITV